MRNAFIDWKNTIMKPQFAWIRRHWKGYLAFTAACFAIPLVVVKIIGFINNRRYEHVVYNEEES